MSNCGPGIVIAAFLLGAVSGFSQSPAEPPPALPGVTLEDCVAAARVTSPNLDLASITMDTARTALAQARAKNGLTLGESGAYYHRGNLPGLGTGSTGTSTASLPRPG